MSRRWLLPLLCLSVLFLSVVQFTSAGGEFRVNETNTKVLFEKDQAEVVLAIENLTGETQHARVELRLLDPEGTSRTSTAQVHAIGAGRKNLKLPLGLSFSELSAFAHPQLLWYRLHYRLISTSSSNTLAEGLISLSEIASDVFEIRLIAPEVGLEAGRYRARVQASHPIDLQPAANVRVEGQLTLETNNNRNLKLRASKVTDAKGQAYLDFVLPPRFPESSDRTPEIEGEIEVVAKRGAVVSKVSGEVNVYNYPNILISTDKPLYQPGQTMHVRALVLSPSRYAIADQNCVLQITDPEGNKVYRAVARSSRFGVVSADWSIPENIRLGGYRLNLGLEGDEESAHIYQEVRISRYDLPNFSVSVEPDRKFYLPGQNAEVKVRADYLFGQPVTQGNVRVVRETEREWNYREQKWEIKEDEKHEGKTDAKGVFATQINLTQHQDFGEYDSPFRDLTYIAYFTDPTTSRTEQRRFDLRVTREAIHVYIVEQNDEHYPGLPLDFYVSTFYADGTPARCQVRTRLEDDDSGEPISKTSSVVQTNRYGLAKVSGVRLPRESHDKGIELSISAFDSKGRSGWGKRRLDVSNEPTIRVETDKTLYRAGEPINAVITSTLADQTLNVDLIRNATVIRSERVKMDDGRGAIAFAYKPDMKDRLTVAVYPGFPESVDVGDTRTVLYPQQPELKVNLRTSQESYRPGEDATVDLTVRGAEGSTAESALGLVVFDKAVEERFRSDQNIGGEVSSFHESVWRFFGFDEALAGVTLRDLQRATSSRAVSPEYDLIAEILLNRNRTYSSPRSYGAEDYVLEPEWIFLPAIQAQLAPVSQALADRYVYENQYPNDEDTLRRFLASSHLDLASMRDPWGTPYRVSFSIFRESDVLTLMTAGADKRFNTSDDFSAKRFEWPYFPPIGVAINNAAARFHSRTGGFIRDLDTLRAELAKENLNLDQLRDRWGQPYRIAFEVQQSSYAITFRSGGPDKKFTSYIASGDDFLIWSSAIDYFAEPRTKIESALTKRFESLKQFPENEQHLREILPDLPQLIENLRDPWDRQYYTVLQTQTLAPERMRLENRTSFGNPASGRTEVVPVARMAAYVNVRSMGPDGIAGNRDDIQVATFSAVQRDGQPGRVESQPITGERLSDTHGTVQGVATDSQGAVIPHATVTVKRETDGQRYLTSTNEAGRFRINLLPGLYELRFEAVGFKAHVITSVWVRAASLTKADVALEVGAISETVTVAASSDLVVFSTTNSVSSTRSRGRINVITKSGTSTPRLREYFPETLVWQPSIETDGEGRAKFNFKLADNITTWKVAVIASTEDGRIAIADKEIKAFQPFFVEHEPPRVLTEGDEISLPIVVRNYLEQSQNVKLEIKPESWFALLGPSMKQSAIGSGDAKRETFDFRAVSSVTDGKQRITAIGSGADDAIEKPITVHPDGEEVSVTAGDNFEGSASLELALSENMIPNSSRVELKIYPNLMAHVTESVEAIMERPHGCGEQTISSTYPSLLLLQHHKRTGEAFALRARAKSYVEEGYRRLLNFRHESGGFSYWGNGDFDLALTAYALRFLTEAADFIAVDHDVITRARDLIVRQQEKDGRWQWNKYGRSTEGTRYDAGLTGYITRVLLMTGAKLGKPSSEFATAQKLALDYLRGKMIDEPYMLAAYALATIELQQLNQAKAAIDKLRSLAITKDGLTYWSSQTSTPFFGWGSAGEVEITALALQALKRYCNSNGVTCEADEKLMSQALLFLFKRKDRYGVWQSTQATINVLDALQAMFSRGSSSTGSSAQILVNGQVIKTIETPANDHLNSPIVLDMTPFISAARNRIEVRRADGLPAASVQAVAKYYVPWSASNHAETNVKDGLRLTAKFDKTDARIGDAITCSVEAYRKASAGYGMMLAEIGLPPGADVDRSSLEAALRNSAGVNRYDVLPDRVVVYLWPQAEGVKFTFQFRPRFGLNAKSAPSFIYDYYNPEARATVAPVTFRVR